MSKSQLVLDALPITLLTDPALRPLVKNARSYESQTFGGPMPSGPFVNNKSFFKSKFEWTGFDSGAKVWFQIRAVGTAGAGPWSDPIALIAP